LAPEGSVQERADEVVAWCERNWDVLDVLVCASLELSFMQSDGVAQWGETVHTAKPALGEPDRRR